MTSVQTKPGQNSTDNYKYKKKRMAFSSWYTSAATEAQGTPKCQLQEPYFISIPLDYPVSGFSILGRLDCTVQSAIGLTGFKDLFLMMIKTTRFSIPPMFEKVVTKWKTTVGTPSGLTKAQTPYTAIAHHWTMNARTNNDIERTALWLAAIVLDCCPMLLRRRLVSTESFRNMKM